jgi:hypothetical protein
MEHKSIPKFFDPLKSLNNQNNSKDIPCSLYEEFYNKGGKILYLPFSFYKAKGSYWVSMPVNRLRRKYRHNSINHLNKG